MTQKRRDGGTDSSTRGANSNRSIDVTAVDQTDTPPPYDGAIDRESTPIGPTDCSTLIGELVETVRDFVRSTSRLVMQPTGRWLLTTDTARQKVWRGYGLSIRIESDGPTDDWSVSLACSPLTYEVASGCTREEAWFEAMRVADRVANSRANTHVTKQ